SQGRPRLSARRGAAVPRVAMKLVAAVWSDWNLVRSRPESRCDSGLIRIRSQSDQNQNLIQNLTRARVRLSPYPYPSYSHSWRDLTPGLEKAPARVTAPPGEWRSKAVIPSVFYLRPSPFTARISS